MTVPALAPKGRPPKNVAVFDVADLGPEDLVELKSTGPSQATRRTKNIRARHHTVAMLMAMGYPDVKIGRITGYDPVAIQVLKNSPAFEELLSHYVESAKAKAFSLLDKLSYLAEEALERLGVELVDNDDLSPEFILKAVEKLADRAGYAPVQKSEIKSFHAVLTAEDIEDHKRYVHEKEHGTVVETRFEREAQTVEATLAEVDETGGGSAVGGASGDGSEASA